MIFQQGVEALAEQASLDPLSNWFQTIIKQVYRAGGKTGLRIADILNGTWLGHPLHPALTDIPVGAWTAASILDMLNILTGSRTLGACADTTTAIGTAVGVVTVLAGLTEGQHPSGQARRISAIHGLTNIGVTLVQGISLAARALGNRRTGQALSALAYGSVIVSSYLGGELLDKFGVGVNHAAQEKVPEGWVPVMAKADLPENELRQVDVNGSPVLLVRRGDKIYALHAICTHLGGPLPRGLLVGNTVQCPWHGSRFDLSDGHVVQGPASFPERCLATRIRNGQIEVGPGAGLGRCEQARAAAGQLEPAMAAAARL